MPTFFSRASAVALVLLTAVLSSCGSNSNFSSSAVSTCRTATQNASTSLITTANSNTIPIYVADPSTTGSIYYLNEPLVSVTLCSPNHTQASQCQTISNILLDTGSYGLRVFSSTIPSNVALTPQTVTVSGQAENLAECATFGSGSDWGPVENADIGLGNIWAKNIPIQVIDSSYGSLPGACAGADTDPCSAGFNGILGVGLFTADCGTDCTSTSITGAGANPGQYFGCTSTSCKDTYSCAGSTCAVAVSTSQQVTNPISYLPSGYNNGLSITLPAVNASLGQSAVQGTVTFGIGSTAFNTPPNTVSVYSADSAGQTDGYGADFLTVFNSNSNTTYGNLNGSDITAFIDSGSNAYYFPSVSGLSSCSDAPAFFCPATDFSLLATIEGITATPTSSINFSVVNFDALYSYGNTAYSTMAGGVFGGYPLFDWGLPFFYGRTVYVGLEGASATFNGTNETGPYWAF